MAIADHPDIHKIKTLYESVGKQDMPTALSLFSDDIEMIVEGPTSISLCRTCRGKDAVGKFFQDLGTTSEISALVPTHFVRDIITATVVTKGYTNAKLRIGGQGYHQEWTMWFWFNASGKINKHTFAGDWSTFLAAMPEQKAPKTTDDGNIKTVQAMYACFGRQDIKTMQTYVTPDVDWHAEGIAEVFSFCKPFKGPEGVAQFFTEIGQWAEIELFEPQEFYAQNNVVIVKGRSKGKSRSNGIQWNQPWTMYFYFNDKGQVCKHREVSDSSDYLYALSKKK